MIYIEIAETSSLTELNTQVDISSLERAALETIQLHRDPAQVDLTIVLSDEAQLHELNLQFMGIDAPTDVLSFPAGETDPDSGLLYLGDIIISVPRAQTQAAAAGHAASDELRLLVVHGVLHLLGYDHGDETEKQLMWARQAEVLQRLGCPQIAPK